MATKDKNSIKNRAYFEHIDKVKKAAQLAHRREYASVLKEVSDILSEAYDEYEPSDLPKYQAKLNNIIRLSKEQGLSEDVDFNNILTKSKELLDNKVKERFGAFQKISYLGAQSARVLGTVSPYVSDFLQITDRAAEAGRIFGNLGSNSKKSNQRVDSEEERRQYDLVKGNTGQYGNSQKKLTSDNANSSLALPPGSITPVKDEKLIGTNTEQNKVLIQLVNINKDTNRDIKQIRQLLISDAISDDLSQDQSVLSAKEAANEYELTRMPGSNVFGYNSKSSKIGKPGGMDGQDDSSIVDDAMDAALLYQLLKKSPPKVPPTKIPPKVPSKIPGKLKSAGKFLGKVAPYLYIAQSLYDSYNAIQENDEHAQDYQSSKGAASFTDVLYSATLGLPELLMSKKDFAQKVDAKTDTLKENVSKPIIKGGQSISARIGEAVKGVDYYKKLFSNPELLQGDQDQAEQWALEYLEELARQRQALFDEAFADGSLYGNGSYQINGNPQTREEASLDVQTAKEKARDYAEYIQEKKKKGGAKGGINSGPNARFRSNGKLYTNPLYSDDHSRKLEIQHRNTVNTQAALREEAAAQSGLEIKGNQTDPTANQFEFISSETRKPVERVPTSESMYSGDELGSLSKKHEVGKGGPGTISSGRGDPGGKSYGSYQLASNRGRVHEFLEAFPEYKSILGTDVGSPAFDARWKALAESDPQGFEKAQHEFIKRTHFDPQIQKLAESGIDLSQRSKPIQDAIWSTSVQYGPNTSVISDALKGLDISQLSDEDIANAIQNSKLSRKTVHGSMDLKPRINSERADLLKAIQYERNKLELQPQPQAPLQMAMNQMSKEQDAASRQPIVIPVPSGGGGSGGVSEPSVSTKSMGASPNGVSESSMLLALRQSIASLFG